MENIEKIDRERGAVFGTLRPAPRICPSPRPQGPAFCRNEAAVFHTAGHIIPLPLPVPPLPVIPPLFPLRLRPARPACLLPLRGRGMIPAASPGREPTGGAGRAGRQREARRGDGQGLWGLSENRPLFFLRRRKKGAILVQADRKAVFYDTGPDACGPDMRSFL